MRAARVVQVINERESEGRVRLAPPVGGGVGAHESARSGRASAAALTRQTEVGRVAADVDGDGGEVGSDVILCWP